MAPRKTPSTQNSFVGRIFEQQKLRDIISSNEASLVVVHGRRRVGKTELIEHTFRDQKIVKFEGREKQPPSVQQEVVLEGLFELTKNRALRKIRHTSWRAVLDLLADTFENGRWIIFLEEFQWLCCYETELISELKYIWDNRLRHNSKLTLVLCGSSPSFMIKEVVYSKALYNRSLHEVALKPFTLHEATEFLGPRFPGVLSLNAFLAVGGVPEYLKYIRRESALIPALAKHSFLPDSFFRREKKKVFLSALSENPHYEEILDYLATVRFATREEIIRNLRLKHGGGNLTRILVDLELCSFIERYTPLGAPTKKRLQRYAIRDNYLQFYYRYVQHKEAAIDSGRFIRQPASALPIDSFEQYLGYAFERFCRQEAHLFADILGFAGVDYESGSLFNRTDNKRSGYQIDLAYRRADRVLTFCEVKHSRKPVDSDEAQRILEKFSQAIVPKHYALQRVLISTAGATKGVQTGGFFDRIIYGEEIWNSKR